MEATLTEATTGRLFLLKMVHGHCVTITQFALPSKPNLGNLSWNLGRIQLHICCSMKDWRSERLIYSDTIAHLTCLKMLLCRMDFFFIVIDSAVFTNQAR